MKHIPQDNIERQDKATAYYDKFSRVYDVFSSKAYYHKARLRAVKELRLTKGKTVLNVPVGTGQNFEYFQQYLGNSGLIVGVDISSGMLDKARIKIDKNQWSNITLLNQNVISLGPDLVSKFLDQNSVDGFDAILCDLGLSGFPQWEEVIDSLISMLAPTGRISIMDWYIEGPSLRGSFVKWIGKGEVNRPIWQYLETKVTDFTVDASFNRGGIFVASGTRKVHY